MTKVKCEKSFFHAFLKTKECGFQPLSELSENVLQNDRFWELEVFADTFGLLKQRMPIIYGR